MTKFDTRYAVVTGHGGTKIVCCRRCALTMHVPQLTLGVKNDLIRNHKHEEEHKPRK